ncbi:MAG: hypothetical protein K6T88_15345 [Bacillus sp. (in: Bacteria)]|nr:hypothetical protein [Bacillus sp. (in: firmicutes)]
MKEIILSEKTGKFQWKKRVRKSIANEAPALIVSILEYKCKFLGAQNQHLVSESYQYNHKTDVYQKKRLH